MAENVCIEVDIIVPVHNAEATLEETVNSALHQEYRPDEREKYEININVCCYDDGSNDSSWNILLKLKELLETPTNKEVKSDPNSIAIPARLLIAQSANKMARGAGFARNRAAELSDKNRKQGSKIPSERFMCWLDSDDIMHPIRVAEQVSTMMKLSTEGRQKTLLGCKVQRDPPDSTWHYTQWANGLTNKRLYLEKFREVTLLQPTWFLSRSRFERLGGYIEAPAADSFEGELCSSEPSSYVTADDDEGNVIRLVHPTFDNSERLRLAEDLRLFHAHLSSKGLLQLHTSTLLTYRHRANQSQSSQTSRKLLLHLRALAFERCVLNGPENQAWSTGHHNGAFVVWGAGRDGRDFIKALSEDARKRVYCFVDVDEKKIKQGFYACRDPQLKVPIVHFSQLAKGQETRQHLLNSETTFGQIDKSKPTQTPDNLQDENMRQKKRQKSYNLQTKLAASPQVAKIVDLAILPELPVVVCVAMYRTKGALEANVASIGREEGNNLWHFS